MHKTIASLGIHARYQLARHSPAFLLKRLPARTQYRLLCHQPSIDRVINVDIRRVADLCYPQLEGCLERQSMAFATPLAGWRDGAGGDHFMRDVESGLPLTKTREYRNLMAMIEAGHRPKGLGSHHEVIHYLEEVLAIFEIIRDQGFRNPDETERGIEVCIDETGRLCKVWGGGTHRYGLARRLHRPLTPVYVRHAHRHWLDRVIRESPEKPLTAVEAGIAALGDA